MVWHFRWEKGSGTASGKGVRHLFSLREKGARPRRAVGPMVGRGNPLARHVALGVIQAAKFLRANPQHLAFASPCYPICRFRWFRLDDCAEMGYAYIVSLSPRLIIRSAQGG